MLSRGYLSTKGNSDMGIIPRQFMLDWGMLCPCQEHKELLSECSYILLNAASSTDKFLTPTHSS